MTNLPTVKTGTGEATPDRVCTNCGQWVWQGRCLFDCQAKGLDPAPTRLDAVGTTGGKATVATVKP